jgi:hypothetical protein
MIAIARPALHRIDADQILKTCSSPPRSALRILSAPLFRCCPPVVTGESLASLAGNVPLETHALQFPLRFHPLGDKSSLLTEKSVRHGETLKLKALENSRSRFDDTQRFSRTQRTFLVS